MKKKCVFKEDKGIKNVRNSVKKIGDKIDNPRKRGGAYWQVRKIRLVEGFGVFY